MKIVKRIFGQFVATDEDYAFVLDDICEHNRKIVMVLCSICTVIFSVLVLLGAFHIGVDQKDLPVFVLALIFTAGLLLMMKLNKKHSRKTVMAAVYITIAAVMVYGLVISWRAPEQYTVTFIVMMGIISMTFVDKPVRLLSANALGAAACVGMAAFCKADTVKVADIINIISFYVLSSVGGVFTVNMKIHSYVMDKLCKEDLARDRQRLNAKEMEALQLLTAVKATHDMVVCVNLTRNTYKLIGDESFVTQGDDMEGNFDEVIGIHAARVIPAHRQRYIDTFSRQGLLKACAEGKKEVYLEYQQCDECGQPHWLGTHTMFISDPHSTDVTEITISQNIDERVRKEAQIKAMLAAERDRAEQAQKAKTDFLFQMSHDIRTPMNAIIGFANFIKSSNDLETIHNDYVRKLETAGQQLLMLINDALEMSRIESGKLVFHREVQDIRSIITNVIAVMQTQAEEKNLSLTTDFSVQNPMVNCDQNHMNRVIMNLLSNAVKFTPSGGSVAVSMHETPGAPAGRTGFTLKIADTGIGMSPEFLKRVFEPFEREQTSTVSGMQGTGLGLAIVKRIVEAAGDSVTVESTQGKGTVFTIRMTLYSAGQAQVRAVQESDADAPAMEQMMAAFKGKRILLVEDNEFNLTIAQMLLENAGFSVETAADGMVAVNKVAGAPVPGYYDAILMDVQMPVMNGYEATAAIRGLPDSRAKTAILAVTANAFDTDRENAVAAGMNGHIAKPIDATVLYRTLWELLS